METIKGKVSKIVYDSKDTGFKVLKIKMPKGPILTVTGEFGPEIVKDTIADFHGDYKAHPKYGSNFRVSSYSITHDQEQVNSLQLFLASETFNIGFERAQAVINHFKSDTVRVLDEEPEKLIEVQGIGEISAKSLSETWKEKRQEWFDNRKQYDLRAFLNNLGIKERRVKKILAHFKSLDAEGEIRENPYKLTEIEGFGFSTADYIAKHLGVPECDPLRLRAYIYYMLKVLCPGNGHLYLSKEEIIGALNRYCEEVNTVFVGKKPLKLEDIEDSIGTLVKDKLVEENQGCLYSKDCYMFEVSAVEHLVNIMLKPSDFIFLKTQDIEKHIKIFEKSNGIILSEDQKKALYLFAEEKVFIITGLPGSGKTTLLKAMVSLIKKHRLRLTCMTPTGISAKKLADTVGDEAYTIHRILQFRGAEWLYNEKNKFDTDAVILDEASMIDQEVLYRLLAALKDRTHIIFVGDHNQLPSVGAGNVLRELLNCGMIPTVRLEKIFRQNEASDIIKIAHQIKDGNPNIDNFKSDPKGDVFFLRENSLEKIENFIVRLTQKFKAEKKVTFQTLSPKNQGPLSVDALNAILQEVLNPAKEGLDQLQCQGFVLRKGDRVKVKKNDYNNNIFNGDIGKVSYIAGGSVGIIIDDRIVQLSVDEIDEKIKLAYSLSVHACLPGNCMISTSEGMKIIKDIKINERVKTIKNNEQKVVVHSNTGIKKIYRIKTQRGYCIEASQEHEFLIRGPEGEIMKKLKDIKSGEYACLNRLPIITTASFKINFKNSRGFAKIPMKKIILPTEMNKNLSWLMGALIGDGNYSEKDDGIIEMTKPSSKKVLEEFIKITGNLGLNPRPHKRKNIEYGYYVCSKNFRKWLESLGFDYVTDSEKNFPHFIFNDSFENRMSFISGLIDTDGSISSNGLIRIVSTAEKVIHQAQLLLLSCGIISSINETEENIRFGIKRKKTYYLVLNKKDVLRNKKFFNLKNEHRIEKFKFFCKCGNTYDRNIPFAQELIKKFISFFDSNTTRGKKNKGLSSPASKNVYRALYRIKNNLNDLTYETLEIMKNVLIQHNKPVIPEILDLLEKNILYDKISSIKDTEKISETYEIEVENDHIYNANGFICHNSQGNEYQYIILPFVRQYGKMLLQRNLLYTAITRAKQKVIILGHGAALESAINNSSVYRRNTKLGERIKICLQQRKSGFSPSCLEKSVNSQNVPNHEELSSSQNIEPLPDIE